MAFKQITSPHAHGSNRTSGLMLKVIYACLPALAVMTVFFGPGTIFNVLLACSSAVLFEALILKMRGRPVGFYLRDYSAIVTGILLGMALPPYCPWWLVIVGTASSIILAKQLYGGLGFNPFNPAMVGYVVLLISFPVEMTQWAAPSPLLNDGQSLVGLGEGLQQIWLGNPIDGYTGATPLDAFKQNNGQMVEQFYASQPIFSQASFAGAGWEWVNVAFLLGGIYLLQQKVFTWHTPISMLVTLTLLAALFYDAGSSTSGGSPIMHLFSGATMMGAFLIATDPVSSAVSTKGRIIYGACIGALVYVIRVWGNYPDAVAFAVLLMNVAAPFIDFYTTPRTYGHAKPRKSTINAEEK